MKRIAMLTMAAVVVVAASVAATNDWGSRLIREVLVGTQEVPVVSTSGRGTFTATINRDGTEIEYRLRYSGLEGDVLQAHIHLGAANTNGGISAFLCSNLTGMQAPPPGTQACPGPREGSITGVITAQNILGPTGQGIPAQAIGELLSNMRAGRTYVNVHSSLAPGGEIRAQISADDHRRHD
jgi:CHRD domain